MNHSVCVYVSAELQLRHKQHERLHTAPPQQLGQLVASTNRPAVLNKALHRLAAILKLFVLLNFNQNFHSFIYFLF